MVVRFFERSIPLCYSIRLMFAPYKVWTNLTVRRGFPMLLAIAIERFTPFSFFFVRWVVATLAMHKPIFTMNENEIPPLHIGNLIREQLRLQRRSVAWLAMQIGCKRDNVYKLLRHYYITTDTLMRISLALDYDFFADLSAHFHKQQSV